ncbi:hypothetical protein, partial [Streptomyces otsuchiensis]|uniref:hypothetical protein n=1 Tax=Streptomyces otsuchiensis TaxID=2681388 RepID=UPI0010302A53
MTQESHSAPTAGPGAAPGASGAPRVPAPAPSPDAAPAAPAAHAHRLRALDPLLPGVLELPEPEPGDVELAVPGGAGRYRRTRSEPTEPAALWEALDSHRLHARLDHPEAVATLDDLLQEWWVHVLASHPENEAEAVLDWPSRDTAVTRTLLRNGLAPRRVVAIRPAGRPAPPAPDGVRLRPLAPGDEERAAALWMEELRWDARCGNGAVRPGAEEFFRERFARRAAAPGELGRCWVAEDERGTVRGVVVVEPPALSGWAARLTSVPGPACLPLLSVEAGHRGRGPTSV